MSNFEELTDYKNNIMGKLLTNDNLIKALVNNDKDFINQSLPESINIFEDIVYSYIYPFRYIPNINTEAKTFITMSFTNFDYRNSEFKSGLLNFYIITHYSLVRTEYGSRYDFILKELDKMFNKQYGVGFFKLDLISGGDIFVNENYLGSTISYKFYDFQ